MWSQPVWQPLFLPTEFEAFHRQFGWPMCHRCQKPVEQVQIAHGWETYTVVVSCHGETESVCVPSSELIRGKIRIDGQAFKPKDEQGVSCPTPDEKG